MSPYRYEMSQGFGSSFTPLGKKMLLFYGGIYVLELIFEHWLHIPFVTYLMVHPFGSGNFHIWQILTHPFLHNPYEPIGFLLDCLMFYFFAGYIEYILGKERFLILFYISALGSFICGMLFGFVAGFNVPFCGMLPSLLALIVVFGLINPESSILLMFILPIKAKYISYGTVLITVLTFLAKINPYGAYHLGGILFGYIYFRNPGSWFDPNLLYIRYEQWRYKRKMKARFKVFDGGKKRKDDDGPTLH